MAGVRDSILDLKRLMAAAVIGQDAVIDQLLIALLADGHLLMEGLPGLAKTRTIKTLAKHLECRFSRIQFTPDLLPSDITGTEVYTGEAGGGRFEFQPGPAFGNLILADEINRAPAKAQAAMLEAMEERQVTVAGTTHKLPALYLVMATQNPIEQEGTYPLPEAQMDRFLMHVFVGYATDEDERRILRLVRGEDAGTAAPHADQKVPAEAVFAARREVLAVTVSEAVEKYLVAVVAATRRPADFAGAGSKLAGQIKVGASPRGTLALDRGARARAWLAGRDVATPDDVKAVAHPCLRHRLILSYEAEADGVTKDQVIDELLKVVAVAAWRVLAQRDRVGAIVFDDRDAVEVRPPRSQAAVMRVRAALVARNRSLAVLPGATANPAMLSKALRRCARLATHDGLVCVVTDGFGHDAESRQLLTRIARHNDVLFAFVNDPLEAELPAAGRLVFGDGERQVEVNTASRAVRDGFCRSSADERAAGRAFLLGRRAPALSLSTDRPPAEQVRQQLGGRR